jgi:pyruvate dehydrogenase E2 component (dihydrolipoamide acetyltransferase)
MSDNGIHALTMPKWGLSMKQGKVVAWLADEGTPVAPGDEVLEVETDKIASAVEATESGILRRQVVRPGQIVPVAGLLGVIAPAEVTDADVDQFTAQFLATFVPEETENEEAGSAYETVQVGDYSLRFLRLGEGGDPVILVHGFGGDLDNWLFNQEPLARDRVVYSLDLPGHGQSSKRLVDGTIDEFARVVGKFMDAIEVPCAHLVGHSVGGAVIQKLAADHPYRIKSLSLICSAGLGVDINRAYIDGFITSKSRRELKPILRELFADPSLVTRQLIDDLLKYKRLDGVTEALETLADQLFPGGAQREILRDEVAGLPMPVLVIWGSEDRIIPAAHAENLPESVRVEVLEGYGHMVQMEAANEVNKLLQAHFAAAEI